MMRLPKKYAGITPGEWKAPLPGSTHLLDGSGRCIIDVPMPNGMPLEEGLKNRMIVEDSPRLAAAVVELREGYERIIQYECRYQGDHSSPCGACSICSLQKIARAALTSTKEWAE